MEKTNLKMVMRFLYSKIIFFCTYFITNHGINQFYFPYFYSDHFTCREKNYLLSRS